MSSFLPLPTTTSQLTLTQDGQQAPLILVDGVDGLSATLSVLHITGTTTTTWDASQLSLVAAAINVIVINNQGTAAVIFKITTTGGVQDVSVPVGIGQWAKVYLVPQSTITTTATTVGPLTGSDNMNVFLYIGHT
jgi:hypothetical protein